MFDRKNKSGQQKRFNIFFFFALQCCFLLLICISSFKLFLLFFSSLTSSVNSSYITWITLSNLGCLSVSHTHILIHLFLFSRNQKLILLLKPHKHVSERSKKFSCWRTKERKWFLTCCFYNVFLGIDNIICVNLYISLCMYDIFYLLICLSGTKLWLEEWTRTKRYTGKMD